MKTLGDLAGAVRAGKTFDVEVTEQVNAQETYVEAGMRGRIVDVREEDADVLSFGLNLEPYEAHNDSLARTNYFDAAGRATLTGKQAGYYPHDHIERVWTGASDDDIATVFLLLSEAQCRLYDEYLAQPQEARGSYVVWLEQKLAAAGA